MSISLVKPTAIGTMLSIKNSEGERHEWIVIGHERKGGRYTGYLRVEHKGWLSASVLEADALTDHVDAAHTEALKEERDRLTESMITVDVRGFNAIVMVHASESTLIELCRIAPVVWLRDRPKALEIVRFHLSACGVIL